MITLTAVDLSDRDGIPLQVTRRVGSVRVIGSEGAVTPVGPTSTPPASGGAGVTPIVLATQAAPTPTPASIVVPADSNPVPSPLPTPTGTRAGSPAGQATSIVVATPTRAVVNVTAAAGATLSPAPGTSGATAAPRATAALLTTPSGTPAAPLAPGTAATSTKVMAGSALTPAAVGTDITPTTAAQVIAAAAQPGSLPPSVAAAPGNANPAAPGLAPPGGPDPVTGIVLLAIGLAGAYGFGAVDRQRRRR